MKFPNLTWHLILFQFLLMNCRNTDTPGIPRTGIDLKAVSSESPAGTSARISHYTVSNDTLIFDTVMAGVTPVELEKQAWYKDHDHEFDHREDENEDQYHDEH